MLKMMQEIYEVLPPRKWGIYDIYNSDHENLCIINDHNKNYGEIQPELVTEDHGNELNVVEIVCDPIDITAKLTIKVEVEDQLTTNIELEPMLYESVEKLIHFLAIKENVPTKEVDEFDSFSFDNGSKTQATKVSHNRERRNLKEIIPRKTI
ncbi:hypothetical protein J1N35_023161 [Gossypium stocksii]|uniref:Uncharacterized protein n=1 Tax=Gossypium stocksii TaxID=47602 RepID=A0A9D3VHT8_9ROSI|nr:hypothetical protein J1N35_023161 [Gossypium stocksii]